MYGNSSTVQYLFMKYTYLTHKSLILCALLIGAIISLFATSITASSRSRSATHLPYYFGTGLSLRHLTFYENYGNNLYNHGFPQGKVYLGVRINDYLGIETGYESTLTTKRIAVCRKGEWASGVPVPPECVPAIFSSTAKMGGPYFDLISFYPLGGVPIEFTSSIGVSILNARLTRKTLFISNLERGVSRELSSNTPVLKIGSGIQYYPIEGLGTRFSLEWVNTDKMKILEKDTGVAEVRPKNSIIYGLGIFWVVD
jgi:hypothetical protein